MQVTKIYYNIEPNIIDSLAEYDDKWEAKENVCHMRIHFA